MNNKIIEQFRLLIKQIKIDIDNTKGKEKLVNTYRLKSIETVLKVLTDYKKEIKGQNEINELSKYKGIGEGTIDRINEILKTGKLSELSEGLENNNYVRYIEELETVFGIGRKIAYNLFKNNKIKSVDELKKKVNKGEIEVPDNIKKGLKYYGKILEKIPRSEIDEIHDFLLNELMEIDINLFGTICGSYRRQKPESGDIDFILVNNKDKNKSNNINYLEVFVNRLIKKNFLVESFTDTHVNTKYMGLYLWKGNKNYRRIDIRYIPYESYYSAILYFTGSKNFNKKMRLVALSMGYTLNEYGLFDNNKMFKVKSEKDIFDLLNMEYVKPELRME